MRSLEPSVRKNYETRVAAYIEWLSTNGHADQLATDGTLDYPRLDPQVFLAYLAVSRGGKDTGHNYSSSHLQKHKNAVFNAAAVSKATMPAGFDDQVKKWLSTYGKEVNDAKASGDYDGTTADEMPAGLYR